MDLTDEQVSDEAHFIEQESAWPAWPLLPVKHIGRGEPGHPEDEKCGVIVASGKKEPGTRTVYLKNLWDFKTGALGPQLEGVRTLEFESTEAMVRAGWIGD